MKHSHTIETPDDICALMQEFHYETAEIFEDMAADEREAVASEFWKFFKGFNRQNKETLSRTFKTLLRDYFHLTVKIKALSLAIGCKNNTVIVEHHAEVVN